MVGGRCFFVLEDPSDGLQDAEGAEKLSAALRRGGGGTSLSQGATPAAETKSSGVRWDTQVVCWCGLSLASEGHADPFAGREDQESPRLGPRGSGHVQDRGGITQGTRQCEDRAAQHSVT